MSTQVCYIKTISSNLWYERTWRELYNTLFTFSVWPHSGAVPIKWNKISVLVKTLPFRWALCLWVLFVFDAAHENEEAALCQTLLLSCCKEQWWQQAYYCFQVCTRAENRTKEGVFYPARSAILQKKRLLFIKASAGPTALIAFENHPHFGQLENRLLCGSIFLWSKK